MKRITLFIILLCFVSVQLRADSTATRKLTLVYTYAKVNSDSNRFSRFMMAYKDVSTLYNVNTREIKKGEEICIKVFNGKGLQIGTIYGVPPKSLLEDIYYKYWERQDGTATKH